MLLALTRPAWSGIVVGGAALVVAAVELLIVTVPNYRVLTDPVNDYSGTFEYIWEELTLPISYRSEWREADGSCSRMSGGHPTPTTPDGRWTP